MQKPPPIDIKKDAPQREMPRELVVRKKPPASPEVIQRRFAANPGAAGNNRKARRAVRAVLRKQEKAVKKGVQFFESLKGKVPDG